MVKKLILCSLSIVFALTLIGLNSFTVKADDNAIAYRVATLNDPSHPENGMTWKTEYCTNYTKLSTLVSDGMYKSMQNLTAGWYVVDEDITVICIKAVESGVNIILQDGLALTTQSKSINDAGYRSTSFEVTGEVNFYGQENNTGKLCVNANAWDGISGDCKGATINFYGGTIISKGDSPSDHFAPGIGSFNDQVNIYGGNIEAYGGDTAPGICCCGDDGRSHLNIYGGTVYAQGGNVKALNQNVLLGGPGIGGFYEIGASGLNIYGGEITAKGNSGGAGIGGSGEQDKDSPCTDFNFYGGKVTAIGVEGGTGIGSGENGTVENFNFYGGTIYADGGNKAVGIGSSGTFNGFKNIKIYGGDITAVARGNCAGIGGKGSGIYIYGGTVKATGGSNAAAIGGSLEQAVSDIHIEGGDIKAIGGSKGAGIGASFKGTVDGLYITGGTIYALGGKEAAGIGGSYKSKFPKLEITGGYIVASGGEYAAGIGGGKNSVIDQINISNAEVVAVGGNRGAGIGAGADMDGSNITINSSTITANGGKEAAGIGGSYKHKGYNIVIKDSNLTVTGGEYAAGIGGGREGEGNDISITGGSVVVKGGAEQGAGIGGGDKASANNITITNSYVKANANNGSPAIGAGRDKNCGTITINGGVIEAKGGYWAPGIGSGCNAGSGTAEININNAVVMLHAVDGGGYPAIGLGPWSSSKAKCNINITGANQKIYNLDTMNEITDGQYGTSSLLITNGTMISKGISVKAVEVESSISEESKAKLESILAKFNIEPTKNLILMTSQVSLAQRILGLTDQEVLEILADPDQHIEISIDFEVTVMAADFSNNLNPVIDYSLKPIARAKWYNSTETLGEDNITLTPEDFEQAQGEIKVTMPVPTSCTPTMIRHTGDGGIIYNEFYLDNVNCVFNFKEGTVTVYINHCSHLVTYFEYKEEASFNYIPLIIVGGVLLVGAGLFVFFYLKRKKNNA